MPMTAQQQADAYQFFIVAFGAAPGTVYMDQLNTAYDAGLTTKQIVNNYTTKEAFTARYPNFLSNGDFATSLVSNVVGDSASAAAKAEAVADITAALNSGFTRGDVIFQVFSNLAAKDKADATWGGTAQQFENQVAVAKYVTQDLLVSSTNAATLRGYLSGVTQDIDTVQTAKDAAVGGNVVATTSLTAGTDNISGTAGNDFFEANLAQNPGAGGVSNTLSSADKIAGGGGTDTLRAELVPEFFGTVGVNQIDVQPTISGVEIIKLEAREFNELNSTIVFDAKKVTGVNKIGSTFSDANLVIENLTTLTDAGVARNTEAITVTMDHTDNFNSDGDASDLTVLFDEDYLLAGVTSSSTLELRLVNNLELAVNDTALIAFERVSFSVGEQLVVVDITPAMVALKGADAYNALIAGIQAKLTEMKITDVTVSALPVRSAVFTDDLGGFSQGAVAGFYTPIQIVSTGATLARGQAQVDNTTLNFNGLNTQLFNSATGNVPITVNVELDKVGRDGEGGNLVIGGKDQNLNGDGEDAAQAQADGISVFNVKVMGNATLPSNLGFVTSTNQALDTVNISSAAAAAGQTTFASLILRDAFNGDTANTTNATNVETVNANAFLGDLTIGSVTAAQNIDTFTATGGGKITLVENITGAEKGVFSVTTGAGNDNITVNLDGDAVDSLNTGLFINTGGGNDRVTVTGQGDVSDATTLKLGNLSINTGAGADRILVNADHIYEVNAGADSDFVTVDSDNAASALLGNGSNGRWSIGDGSDAANTDWADRVLYEAKLTVDFAGFTETVTIKTNAAGSFIATQQDINNAVIDAITKNPELARLLTTTVGTGTAGSQQLTINSTVQGVNDLSIQVVQPTLVETGATGTQVNFGSTLISAMQTGLVNTTNLDSAATDTAAEIIAAVNARGGNLNQTGAVAANDFVLDSVNGVDGTNNTTATSNAIIDMGTGANDLVALDSDVNSSDTLVFSAAWGKVSVLNFFNAQSNDGAGAGTDINHAGEVVGNHRLDFTAFLDDQISTSTSVLSATPIATTLLGNGTANNMVVASNQVTIVRDFAAGTLLDASETWANLNGTQLQNALNGVTIGTGGYGNIGKAANVSAPANLLGTTIDSIIMVENTANLGEYKVFNAEVGNLGTTDTFVVTDLGTIDFGESISGAGVAGLTLANLVGSGVAIAPPVVPGAPTFAVSAPVAAAEGTSAVYTITMSAAQAAATSVNYTLGFVGGADASDLGAGTALAGSLTFAPGATTVTVSVPFATDAVSPEAGEGVSLTVGTSTATTMITDVVAGGSVAVAINAADTFDAAAFDFAYTVAMGNYAATINNFSAGDQIFSPAGVVGTLVQPSFTDGEVTIQYASAGQVATVTLTGLTNAQDASFFGTSDLNVVFGAGTFA